MIVKEIKGNILDTKIKHIAHGVNCQGVMGSGVAKALYTKWPMVKSDYLEYCDTVPHKEKRLGEVTPSFVGSKTIWNLFTQYNYGRDNQKYLIESALIDSFAQLVQRGVEEVAIPRIGCGLAGGDWEVVKNIINKVSGPYLDVYVYYLED